MNQDLADLWIRFATAACGEYSPLYEQVSRAVAADEQLLDLISAAPAAGHMPTVFLAAVHYLILGGTGHRLEAVYGGAPSTDLAPLLREFCLDRREELLHLLATRHTNTNEVGRSALLGPALTTLSGASGLPLGLVDVGCSAGINLFCDRYRLDYGSAGVTGPVDAAVEVRCTVVGGDPPIAPDLPPVVARVGIDVDPVDVTDEDQVRWQLACVWPDTGRLDRTRSALEVVRGSPPDIVKGDAVDEVARVLLAQPEQAMPVVITTWALAYLSRERRVEFRRQLQEVSRQRPLSWVALEGRNVLEMFAGVDVPDDANNVESSLLALTVFDNGRYDARLLGFAHAHGNWLDWQG